MTIRVPQAKLLFFVAILLPCLVWLISAPSDPDGIFAAFPPELEMLCVHDDLGQRIGDAFRNPVVQGLLHTLLQDSGRAIPESEESASLVWLRRLCGQRAVVALPPQEVYGRRVVLFATACGGWSQRLRWLACLGRIPATPAADCEGVAIWEYKINSGESARIFFACLEGAVLGCYGPDPIPLEDAIRRYSRMRPRLMAFRRFQNRPPSPTSRRVLDRGWIRIGATDMLQRIDWSVSLLSPEALSLRFSPVFSERMDLIPSCAPQSRSDRAHCRLAAGDTLAEIRVPVSLLYWISERCHPPVSALMAACATTAQRLGGDTVDLLILRLSNARSYEPDTAVPVLVIHSRALADAETALSRGLDVFNRLTGWNLILRPAPSPESSEGNIRAFYCIESGLEGSPYDHLPMKYQPAFAVLKCGGILAPQCIFELAGALPSCTETAAVDSFPPDGSSATLLAARLNLEKLAGPLRRIVSLYVLRSLVSGQPQLSHDGLRRLLEMTRMWTSVLRKAGQAYVLARVDAGNRLAVTLEFKREVLRRR